MNTNLDLLTGSARRVLSRTVQFWAEPARVFSQVAHVPGSVLLESQPGSADGRYSVICVEPFGTLCTSGGQTTLTLPTGPVKNTDSPFEALRNVLATCAVPFAAGALFPGGAVGYLGYELGTFLEDVPISAPDDVGLPDCWLGFYNHAVVFDRRMRTMSLNVCTGPGLSEPEGSMASLEEMVFRPGLKEPIDTQRTDIRIPTSSFARAGYCAAIERVQEYIAAGDVYQVNLSQRFTVPFGTAPWEMYLRLRQQNPAPYAAYINAGNFQVVSSSPECFLTYDPVSRLVETKPIKGTRPRGADAEDDDRLASELARSEKDLAENVMIVDLERNDLGRVCEFGSVGVPELAFVETHPTVHHLVSTVTGRLRSERDSIDLLTACFPGGSITGAPKIRAMEIIDELEPVRRGVYTGVIGYLGFDGSVNLNIAIRTAAIKDDLCRFHVGGGIVADSDPDAEYQETLDKGRAFFEVLGCQLLRSD